MPDSPRYTWLTGFTFEPSIHQPKFGDFGQPTEKSFASTSHTPQAQYSGFGTFSRFETSNPQRPAPTFDDGRNEQIKHAEMYRTKVVSVHVIFAF